MYHNSVVMIILLGFITLIISVLSYFTLDMVLAKRYIRYGVKYPIFWRTITNLGYLGVLLFFALVSLNIGYFIHSKVVMDNTLFFMEVVIVSGILSNLSKIFFGRHRPSEWLDYGKYGFLFFKFNYKYMSFPSGHSATVMSAFSALAFIFSKFYFILLLMGFVCAYSRVAVAITLFFRCTNWCIHRVRCCCAAG